MGSLQQQPRWGTVMLCGPTNAMYYRLPVQHHGFAGGMHAVLAWLGGDGDCTCYVLITLAEAPNRGVCCRLSAMASNLAQMVLVVMHGHHWHQ